MVSRRGEKSKKIADVQRHRESRILWTFAKGIRLGPWCEALGVEPSVRPWECDEVLVYETLSTARHGS